MTFCLCWVFQTRKDLYRPWYNEASWSFKEWDGYQLQRSILLLWKLLPQRNLSLCMSWLAITCTSSSKTNSVTKKTERWFKITNKISAVQCDGGDYGGVIILHARMTKTNNYKLLKSKKLMKMTYMYCSWHLIYHLILDSM